MPLTTITTTATATTTTITTTITTTTTTTITALLQSSLHIETENSDIDIPGSPRSPGRAKPGSPRGPGRPLGPGSPGLPGGPTGPDDPGRPTKTQTVLENYISLISDNTKPARIVTKSCTCIIHVL